MSNRDSLGVGELLPQDVVDIFAQEKQGNRGRKKRSRSLGRALGWLKGKKRKDAGAKGPSLGLGMGLGPALDLALNTGRSAGHHKGSQRTGRPSHSHGNSHAAPKRDDDDKAPPPPLFHENVFIEASRPKYVEDLHTEALEGLKMMQQQETNNGVEFQDNESTVSAMTVHTDGEGEGFVTDSTIADSTSVVSVQSSVSSMSSRSGLTRQGSTFRPLNSGKRSEKAKMRRRHRKTVDGIPRHVQRELGLDRAAWAATPTLDEEEQLHNGESDVSLPSEGPQQATESGGGLRDVIPGLSKQQLQQLGASHAGHRDDLALLHCLGPDLSAGPRPQSLAVPWMTTANSLLQAPPSPVMSMSPQAAYMSKIIPNAVLPPSIDVVEISRGRNSRNSVRTVSKSSLLVSSPAPSRASSRASTITSASQHNPPHMSDSSCWSNSESSETLVSDSSTISSNSTSRQKSRERDGSAKEDRVSVHSSVSKASKCTSNGKVVAKGDEGKKEGPFVRSLSVMKPKRAPPPPSRSYSLHNKMKRRSRDLAEVRIISEESPPPHSIPASADENDKNSRIIDSPGYHADTSSLDESMNSSSFSPQLQALKAEQAAKTIEAVSKNASQERQKPLQESKPATTLSPSSGYSSQEGTSAQLSKETHSSSPRHKRGIFAKLQKLFPGSSPTPPVQAPVPQPQAKATENIKPVTSVDITSVNPSVKALLELFNIPPPPKVHAPPPPPPEVWAHSKRSFELLLGPPAPDNIYAIIKKNPKDRRQQRKSGNESPHTPEKKKVQESGILTAEVQKESDDRLAEQNVDVKGNRKVTENEKVIVSGILNGMLVKAAEKREERLATVKEEETKNKSTQAVKTYTDTIPAISAARIPPCPSPPPAHNPPQPPNKQTTETVCVSSMPVVVSPESWPPPPPPMGLSGPDDIDFPLPPPPMFGEEEFVMPVQVPPEIPIPGSEPSSSSKPQKPHTSQGIAPTPLNIPPPPPYTAPPPPLEAVHSSTFKKASPPPPPKVVFLPPSKKTSPLPPKKASPPPKEISPPPPKEISPPPPKEISPPPPPKEIHTLLLKEVVHPPPEEIPPPPPKETSPSPKEVSLPPPIEISPATPKEAFPPPPGDIPPAPTQEISPSPKEVSPPPPKEDSPPPPKEVSPPPPEEVSPPPPPKVVSLPPKEDSPPPPPKEVSPTPPKEVSPPPKEISEPSEEISAPHEVVSPSPPPKEICAPPSLEVSPPQESIPSPIKEVLPPPSREVLLVPPEEVSSPPLDQVSPPLSDQVSPEKPTESSASVAKESPPPLVPDALPIVVTAVSSSPVQEEPVTVTVSPTPPSEVSTKEVSPAASAEISIETTVEDTSVSRLTPPQSIPPPPPQPQSSEQEIDVPEEKVQPESKPTPSDSILTPPQSIPPPPPIQPQHQVAPPVMNGAAPQETIDPPPSESSTSPTLENSPSDKTEESQVPASAPPANIPLPLEDPPSVESQPSPTCTENQTLEQTTTTAVSPSIQQVNSSPEPPKAEEKPEAEDTLSGQPPSSQILPISTSAEAPQKPIRKSLIITSPSPSQQALPKSQSLVIPTGSSSTALSPTKKSPPTMATSPSMNLQEAIRLRTAARARGGAPSHLNLHSPTSPMSPTSTASFIFSKSNRKVVVETKAPEKAASEAELAKKDVKVPPPVARKPKSKGKESDGTEQTAGQEAQTESVKDAAEKTNGTAGTVEGGEVHPA